MLGLLFILFCSDPRIRLLRAMETSSHQRNGYAFAAVTNPSSSSGGGVGNKVVVWGSTYYGGDYQTLPAELSSGSSFVGQIFSTESAYAALMTGGKVVTWGDDLDGADSSPVSGQLQSGVVDIISSSFAFCALKTGGQLVVWGSPDYGGDATSVQSAIQSGIVSVYANTAAFVAVKVDSVAQTQTVVGWGSSGAGGMIPAAVVQELTWSLASSALTISNIYTTGEAFAALISNGQVVTWGNSGSGGDSSNVAVQLEQGSGVESIASTVNAFAAIMRESGAVVTWGESFGGGDSSSVAAHLQGGVARVFSAQYAFAALTETGAVITWGNVNEGGDSSSVANQLQSGVISIAGTFSAFAALKADSSIVTWGYSEAGGDSVSSGAQTQLQMLVNQGASVIGIFPAKYAFAALTDSGAVVAWGNPDFGGDTSSVSNQLAGVTPSTRAANATVDKVVTIATGNDAFAALTESGSLVVWGSANEGGSNATIAAQLGADSIATVFGCETYPEAGIYAPTSAPTLSPTNSSQLPRISRAGSAGTMSAGQVAGLVLGLLAAISLTAVVGYAVWRKRRGGEERSGRGIEMRMKSGDIDSRGSRLGAQARALFNRLDRSGGRAGQGTAGSHGSGRHQEGVEVVSMLHDDSDLAQI